MNYKQNQNNDAGTQLNISEKYKEMKYKKRRRRKRNFIVFFVLLIIFLGGGAFYAYKYLPNFSVDPFEKYLTRNNPDEITIIYKDEIINSNIFGVKFENSVLIDVKLLDEKNIDNFVYLDSEEEILTITNPQSVVRFKSDEPRYTENGNVVNIDDAMYLENNTAYIPASFLREYYNLDIIYEKDSKFLIIDPKISSKSTATVVNKSNIRYSPNIKSEIAEVANKGDTVTLFGNNGVNGTLYKEGYAAEFAKSSEGAQTLEEDSSFIRVRSDNGTIGYIKKTDIADITETDPVIGKSTELPPYYAFVDKKITLVWDQVTTKTASELREWINTPLIGVNVVSPTWFEISDTEGNIKDIASSNYVRKAHNNGYEVWALATNSFNREITHEVLRSTAKRQKIIDRLIELSKEYDLDGINIDFEEFSYSEDGENFNQFMKELSPMLHEEDLAVSVDVHVPSEYTAIIDKTEIARYVDYIMIMAYDEHWSSAPESGSVASYGWVINGIENMLDLTSKDKILLGLPLYTRIWTEKETAEGIKLSSKSVAMQDAIDIFNKNKAEIVWDENKKQYVGQYVTTDTDGSKVTSKVWLEEEKSLTAKAELINSYDLAGAACWKKGLEMEFVWGMLSKTIKS